jgi:hypothetical protein
VGRCSTLHISWVPDFPIGKLSLHSTERQKGKRERKVSAGEEMGVYYSNKRKRK